MTLRTTAPPLDLSDDDDEEDGQGPVELRSVDPLAAEPLTNEEMLRIERVDPDIDEDLERQIRAMGKTTEADMPIDFDAAEGIEPATDQKLGMRTRPKSKR